MVGAFGPPPYRRAATLGEDPPTAIAGAVRAGGGAEAEAGPEPWERPPALRASSSNIASARVTLPWMVFLLLRRPGQVIERVVGFVRKNFLTEEVLEQRALDLPAQEEEHHPG